MNKKTLEIVEILEIELEDIILVANSFKSLIDNNIDLNDNFFDFVKYLKELINREITVDENVDIDTINEVVKIRNSTINDILNTFNAK